jgi:predicted deacylase
LKYTFLLQVSDELAMKDAHALYTFLVRRGYIEDDSISPLTETLLNFQQAVPLNGVDMIEATAPGLIAWKIKAGDHVKNGQLLGEIVNIEDIDAARIPIVGKTSGIVFGLNRHKLAIPGDVVVYVAGNHSLDWRQGHLLLA